MTNATMEQELKQLTLPAGTIVKLKGMPFRLASDTSVLGREENLQFASSHADASGGTPNQAAARSDTSTTRSDDD